MFENYFSHVNHNNLGYSTNHYIKKIQKNLSSTPDYNLNDHKLMNKLNNKSDLQNIAEGKVFIYLKNTF